MSLVAEIFWGRLEPVGPHEVGAYDLRVLAETFSYYQTNELKCNDTLRSLLNLANRKPEDGYGDFGTLRECRIVTGITV